MKTVALISGGKDSCFNMMSCIAEGHDVVALANLRPQDKDELDSYMYQTVGHHAIYLYAEAMDLPLYTRIIKGSSVCKDRDYLPQEDDEVEDLFELLAQIKNEKDIEAVSVGAILSDYQRVRVENVCQRLDLKVLSFLWRRDQEELLKEMIACGVKAIIIKVAALGLLPKLHLGMELSEILPHMLKMKKEYGLNECGEGGEYETFVFDCPLFKKSIVIDEKELINHSEDAFAPVAYLNLKKCHLEAKTWDEQPSLQEKILKLPITTSSNWLNMQLSSQTQISFEETSGSNEPPEKSCFEPSIDEELERLPPLAHSDGLSFQVAGVRAFTSSSVNVAMATQMAMDSLMSCVKTLGHCVSEIVSMSLYVRDMSCFAAINTVYNLYFKINPPVRLCIQPSLPPNVALQFDCQGRRSSVGGPDDRLTMHVQALSHWAPANIGPYSQAIMIGRKLFVAGIVPLIPASLTVIDAGIVAQCQMSLLYIRKVLKAMCPSCSQASCPMTVCFVTNCKHIDVAKQTWMGSMKEDTNGGDQVQMPSLLQICVVPKLPRNVFVEWQVFAWPFLQAMEEMKTKSILETHLLYTLRLEYCSVENLFSCRIVAVSTEESPELTTASVEKLACDVLRGFFTLQSSHDLESTPLVKIFFPSAKFTSSQLHKAFIPQLSILGKGDYPVLSFIPVLQLETEHHLLAWCQ